MLDWLLQYAFNQRASDIHLEPRRVQSNIRFRIDGIMYLVHKIPTSVIIAVISRIKVLARMNITERRIPQDGRFKITNNNKEVELRLSTMPTAFGEKVVMRIFSPDILLQNFTELGFNARDKSLWFKINQTKHGIVLVTGPTGSGKTTTLHVTLSNLVSSKVNVCTIEDPIELIDPLFNQMQVNNKIGLSFSSGIRTLLRQDPDIIMVGEIRDFETAEIAIQASLTGHLVLSTLHTNNASSAVTRLLEIGIKSYLIKMTLLGVMAQRLIRTLCPNCKTQHNISDEQWLEITHPLLVNKPATIYQATGCVDCRNTGYFGRTGIYEIFVNTKDIQKHITPDCNEALLAKTAIKEGMVTLKLNGINKIAQGITSIEEILRVMPSDIEA